MITFMRLADAAWTPGLFGPALILPKPPPRKSKFSASLNKILCIDSIDFDTEVEDGNFFCQNFSS